MAEPGKNYLVTIWSDLPHNSEPEVAVIEAALAEQENVLVQGESLLESLCKKDRAKFVAIEAIHGEKPTCFCCQPCAERHQHMATLYHWDAMMLAKCNPAGVVSSTKPAPLDADDIEFVFSQLAQHPNYQGQTVVAIAEDFKIVELAGGHIRQITPS